MNREKLKARAEELQGRIKRAAAELAGSPERHDVGVATEVTDKVKDTVVRLKRTVGEAIEHVGHTIKN